METIIVICLLIVIILLLHDKVVIKKKVEQKLPLEKIKSKLPDIMGQPKPIKSHFAPKRANESQIAKPEVNPANLDIEYDANESTGIQVPQEELDKVFSNTPNFKEEEEEWSEQELPNIDDSFAEGVSFDELSSIKTLLQKDKLEPSEANRAVVLVQKLQGTELFSLLESSLDGASQKMAMLFDRSLSTETASGSSTLRNNNLEDFDIGDFV